MKRLNYSQDLAQFQAKKVTEGSKQYWEVKFPEDTLAHRVPVNLYKSPVFVRSNVQLDSVTGIVSVKHPSSLGNSSKR
jgi:RNA polymerase-interacting CarD/CdnL/TRCF family regulator